MSILPGFCVGTNIIEPGYTRSCTRISKLMQIESDGLRLREKASKPCGYSISETKKAAHKRLSLFRWCRRPDSNRHVFLRLILNQLRLPISPLRHGRGCGNVEDYTCRASPCKRRRGKPALSAQKTSSTFSPAPTPPAVSLAQPFAPAATAPSPLFSAPCRRRASPCPPPFRLSGINAKGVRKCLFAEWLSSSAPAR